MPLTGIKILDLTRLLPGAVATQLLANHGAEVIKIEQPITGDYARTEYPALFAQTNQNKKSVALDLKKDRDKFLQLVAKAQIVVESYRPGVMDRLNLSYETLKTANPKIIYASLTGDNQAGHDINYLALSGILAELKAVPNIQIADITGSMQMVIAILLALRTNEAQRIQINMTDALKIFLPAEPLKILNGSEPYYRVYEAAENTQVAIGALEPKFFQNLCRELDVTDPAALEKIFKTKTAEQWYEQLGDKDCCLTPVRQAPPPPAPIGKAPSLGEHNDEYL